MSLAYLPEHAANEATQMLIDIVAKITQQANALGLPAQ